MNSRADRIAAALMLAAIRLYKVAVAPLLPSACRFHPTCSVYAAGAIRMHGSIQGARMAVARILRCHPLHRGGLDPVPPVGSPD